MEVNSSLQGKRGKGPREKKGKGKRSKGKEGKRSKGKGKKITGGILKGVDLRTYSVPHAAEFCHPYVTD
jgi:hypothetical protein